MSLAVPFPSISDAERDGLVTLAIDKMRQACFIDWIVGLVLAAVYGRDLYLGVSIEHMNLWPLIVALGITRAGNTIVVAVRDATYWIYHRAGERLPNGQNAS